MPRRKRGDSHSGPSSFSPLCRGCNEKEVLCGVGPEPVAYKCLHDECVAYFKWLDAHLRAKKESEQVKKRPRIVREMCYACLDEGMEKDGCYECGLKPGFCETCGGHPERCDCATAAPEEPEAEEPDELEAADDSIDPVGGGK